MNLLAESCKMPDRNYCCTDYVEPWLRAEHFAPSTPFGVPEKTLKGEGTLPKSPPLIATAICLLLAAATSQGTTAAAVNREVAQPTSVEPAQVMAELIPLATELPIIEFVSIREIGIDEEPEDLSVSDEQIGSWDGPIESVKKGYDLDLQKSSPEPIEAVTVAAIPQPETQPVPTPVEVPAQPEPALKTAEPVPVSTGLDSAGLKRLAACESYTVGYYTASNPSGKYRGAYQFDQPTWDGVADRNFPDQNLVGVDPAQASPAIQDAMAVALFNERGKQPWPRCGHCIASLDASGCDPAVKAKYQKMVDDGYAA